MAQTPYNAPVGLAYAHIANAGTTVVKSVPGALVGITINSGGSGATLELFDNNVTVTGTVVIANMALGATSAASTPLAVPVAGGNALNFKTGLVAVATGTVDATIAYR